MSGVAEPAGVGEYGAAGHAIRSPADLNRLATTATVHCLIGCVIGELSGQAIGDALGRSNVAQMALAIGLAYLIARGRGHALVHEYHH